VPISTQAGDALTQLPTFVRLVSTLLDEGAASQLFELFNIIAVLRYEEIENSGTLALCAPDALLPAMLVRFELPLSLRDVRGVRKFLHITDENLCLVSDGRSASGFVSREQLTGDMLTVEFRPAGVWEICRNGEPLLLVEAPPAPTPKRAIDRERLQHGLRATFPELSKGQMGRLCELAAAAARQRHGTNVLISAAAQSEARRLAPQCTLVEALPLTPLLMERCACIDGTVVMDTDGTCYAIGAILDGDVSGRGDRTRGGRYNSALMYVDTTPVPSLIVVVSRDGTVDIVS